MNLNTQKEALHKIRDEYQDLLDSTRGRDRGETLSDETGTQSHIPTDDADIATETFERERDGAFITDYRSVIGQIDRALAKIEDGTYGICERCGERIPDERLEATPYALLCIKDEEIEEGL